MRMLVRLPSHKPTGGGSDLRLHQLPLPACSSPMQLTCADQPAMPAGRALHQAALKPCTQHPAESVSSTCRCRVWKKAQMDRPLYGSSWVRRQTCMGPTGSMQIATTILTLWSTKQSGSMMVAGASAALLWLGSDVTPDILHKCNACLDITSAWRFTLKQSALIVLHRLSHPAEHSTFQHSHPCIG